MSLNIMDYDKFLNTLYNDSCARKEVVNPRTAVLRHSFLRSYIATYYDKCSQYDFADFRRISEEMEDNGRSSLIANLFNHTDDIKALKESHFRYPDLEMIKNMNEEIAKIDERILNLVNQSGLLG